MAMEFKKDTDETLIPTEVPKKHTAGFFHMTDPHFIKKLANHSDKCAERKRNHFFLHEQIENNVQESRRECTNGFHQWRRIELVVTILSTVGLMLAMADYELNLYHHEGRGLSKMNGILKVDNKVIDEAIKIRQSAPYTVYFRGLMCLQSIITILLMIIRQTMKVKWSNKFVAKQIYFEETSEAHWTFQSIDSIDIDGQKYTDDVCVKHNELYEVGLKPGECFHDKMASLVRHVVPEHTIFTKRFFWRVLLQCIFPYPKLEWVIFIPQLASSGVNHVPYFISDIVIIFMFLRIFMIIRHYERYHEFTNLESKAICRQFNVINSRMFSMKSELKFNQFRVIIVLFICSVSVLAYILRIWELPYELNVINPETKGYRNNLKDYGSAIWLTCITMTTVGYGDIYPHTVGGQLTAIVIAIWGTFCISLLIMITSEVFDFSDTEQQAVLYILQRRQAARCILKALMFYQKKKRYYMQRLLMDINYDKKSTFIRMLKHAAKQIDGDENQDNLTTQDNLERSIKLIDKVRMHVMRRKKMEHSNENMEVILLRQQIERGKNTQGQEDLAIDMNEDWAILSKELDTFQKSRDAYEQTLSENQGEQDHSIQIIKKEVIDMADLSDKLSGIIISQQKKINIQTESLEVIRDILEGTYNIKNEGKYKRELKVESDEDKNILPDLFSLRKSALYQNYVCRRQLSQNLLKTRNEYIKEIGKHSIEHFDHKKCVEDPYEATN